MHHTQFCHPNQALPLMPSNPLECAMVAKLQTQRSALPVKVHGRWGIGWTPAAGLSLTLDGISIAVKSSLYVVKAGWTGQLFGMPSVSDLGDPCHVHVNAMAYDHLFFVALEILSAILSTSDAVCSCDHSPSARSLDRARTTFYVII